MTTDRNVYAKGRQLLSDELSARKRKEKEILVNARGVQCLRSRHAAHSDGRMQGKDVDIQEVKSKLSSRLTDGTWDFGHG